jgi:hypothetical protein
VNRVAVWLRLSTSPRKIGGFRRSAWQSEGDPNARQEVLGQGPHSLHPRAKGRRNECRGALVAPPDQRLTAPDPSPAGHGSIAETHAETTVKSSDSQACRPFEARWLETCRV